MPVFTATATALLSSTALAGSFIATNLLASGLAYGAGHLLGVFDVPDVGAAEDQGVELRLAANTQNRLPTLYGEWMERGRTVYAEVSDDKQNYHTVVALGEGPVDSIDKVFWNEYELTFDANGVVTDAVAPDGTSNAQYNGDITVQTYLGTATGNNSTYLEGLSETWTSTDKMTNIVYAVISLKYNRDAGVTSLQDMRFVGTSPVSNPADAIQNLLTNSRYGLGLSSSDLNTASFAAARTHYNDMVNYVDTDGVTVQQTRHEVNGSLATSNDVVNRIQSIGRGCNTELTWSDGQWGLFVNKQDSATSFVFDTSNIIGNVQVVEPGLNSLFNRIELNYGRNSENNYQRAEAFVEASAAVLYPNELTRTQTLDLPLVATSQEAKRVGTLNINQARQQLTVSHTADATAMPLEAGDIVSYTDVDYGWASKLFRITSITEVNEESSLTYQVTAIEYADAVYNFVVNEDDVAPNVPENDVAAITAVDDLAVSGQFPAAATPYIALQWTVPENSLVERFNVFYNLVNDTFDSMNTKLGGTELIPVGNYASGDTVTHQLVGIPAASTVSIWVVASNDFVSSAESNTASVNNWRPTVVTDGVFELITRYNETPSVISGTNIDVGAPPANATGIGTGRNNDSNDTGWYEFDPEASDRENAPVWTATTETQRNDAEPRVIDFDITGTSATQTMVFTPEQQETDFTFSGTVGEREFFYNARPEVTDFTLSGQSADFDAGVGAQWEIDVSGSTDATGPDTNDVFYIAPMGTSNTFTGESFTFTPSGSTSDGIAPENTDASASGTIPYGNSLLPGWRTRADGGVFISALDNSSLVSDIVLTRGSSEYNSIIAFFNVSTSFSDLPSGTILNFTNADGAVFRVTDPMEIRSFSSGSLQIQRQDQAVFTNFTVTPEPGNTAITSADTAFTLDFNSIGTTIASSISITLDSDTNSYTLADNLSGGAAVGAALNTAIGTDYDADWVKTFDATTGAITFTADDVDDHTGSVAVVAGTNGTLTVAPSNVAASGTPTTIQLQVTTESIDETITLGSNLTGTTLIPDVFNGFNGITAITDEFTVEQVTIDIDGTSTEVVRFTANDFVNHVFMLTVNSGIEGTTSGTVTDGQTGGTPTSVRITYDDSITPSFQDITFGSGDDVDAASELTALIDGHAGLSAMQAFDSGDPVSTLAGPSITVISGLNQSREVATLNNNGTSTPSADFLSFNWPGSRTGPGTIFDYYNSDALTFEGATTCNLPTGDGVGWSVGDFAEFLFNIRDNQFVKATYAIRKVTAVSGDTLTIEEPDPKFVPYRSLDLRDDIIPTTVVRFVRNLGSDELTVFEAYAEEDIVRTAAGNSLRITNNADGPVDEPVITITEQGTGDVAFAISTITTGVVSSGTASSYVITHAGLQVAVGDFAAASSASLMASQLTVAINSTSVITGTNSNNVSTATSVANSTSNTSVTVTGGTNKPGGVSTNDAALIGAVSQVGSAIDVFAGVDSVVNVFNGGELYYTQSYSADTIEDIVSDVVDGINVDNPSFSNFFTAGVQADDTNEIVATSDFVGITPTLTMSVIPGFTGAVDAVGNVSQTQATLAVVRTEVSDGQSDPVIDGTLSTYSVTQGSTEVIAATDIPSGTPFGTVATLIATDISDNSDTIDYTTIVDDGTVETTSTFNGATPDLTITIVGGTNADTTLPDIALVKTVTQTGAVGTIDLTDAVWNYAVTSPTTDGDTTMITPDGTIAVRRGLFLNSLAASRDSLNTNNNEVIFGNDLYTTSASPSLLDITGVAHCYISTTVASDASITTVFAQMQYTDDVDDLDNATWSSITGTVSNSAVAQTANATDPLSNTTFFVSLSFASDDFEDLAVSTQYAFRVLLQAFNNDTVITVPNNVLNGVSATFQLQEILTTS